MEDNKIDVALNNEILKQQIQDLKITNGRLLNKLNVNNAANSTKNADFSFANVNIDNLQTLDNEALNMSQYLKFRQSFFTNLNNVASPTSDNLNSSNFSLEFYLMILNRMSYFANMPNYKSDNINLNIALMKCLQNNAFFGSALLIKEIKTNKWFSPTTFYIAYDEFDDIDLEKTNFILKENEIKGSSKEYIIINLQLNYSKFGIWVLTYGYLVNVINMLHSSIAMANTFKNLMVVKMPSNISVNNSNVQGMNDWNKSIINVLIDADDISKSINNIFEVLHIEGQNFPFLHSQIQYYLSFWDKEIGIRVNVDTSQSSGARAISSEMLPTSFAIDKKEMEYYHYLDTFFKKLKLVEPSIEWNFPNLVISDSMTQSKPENQAEGGSNEYNDSTDD